MKAHVKILAAGSAFVIVLASLGVAAFAQPATRSTSTHSPSAWVVRYPASHASDGALIDELMATVHADAMREFSSLRENDLKATLSLSIEIHTVPNEYASTGTMTVVSSRTDGKLDATLHVFAPSLHTAADVTNVGEPKDRDYFHKTLMHEYASLLLDVITNAKPQGWRFHGAPAWVVQGYPEYLSLTRTSQTVRSRTYEKYRRIVAGDPGRIAFEFGIEVTDPYVDGAMLFAFMHEEYGAARVQRVLNSGERTFGRAAARELGANLETFEAAWRMWLDKVK